MGSKVNGIVRVALIGAGGISAAHVTGFLKHKDKIRCVALVDVSTDNLKTRSEQLTAGGADAPKQFGDWKVMLREMAGDVDAADICLPHHLHGPAILDS